MPYASLVIIFNNKRQVLLLKRSAKVDSHPNKWGFPGGRVEEGETSVDAAVREVYEETTLKVFPKKLTYVFNMKKENGKEIVFFLTDSWHGSVKTDWESDDYGWVDIAQLPIKDMVPAPKIVFEMIRAWSKMVKPSYPDGPTRSFKQN